MQRDLAHWPYIDLRRWVYTVRWTDPSAEYHSTTPPHGRSDVTLYEEYHRGLAPMLLQRILRQQFSSPDLEVVSFEVMEIKPRASTPPGQMALLSLTPLSARTAADTEARNS